MAHADEALKAAAARFKKAPESDACAELAALLLARGHASEALRVAEHGLQLSPILVNARIERAAALLALGRPRVAYVELLRALAIEPENRRALRHLGTAYMDAGAPGKAAELLRRRSPAPLSLPDFFASLTGDLGLASPLEESPLRSVEITHVVRPRLRQLGPRAASELTSIEGPIVDTSRAEALSEISSDLAITKEVPDTEPSQ